MCGICGVIYKNNVQASELVVKPMMEQMKHRGPNDSGVYCYQNMALGFVRLSVIDLTDAGHQPMISEDENYVLVFNGEIFNYLELREELELLGVSFFTKTDTEVLLKAYIEWGEAVQHKFNGMWAFAIFNKKEQTLFLSRDRYGIKPLYLMDNEHIIAFASEIPSLLTLMDRKPKPNYQAIFDYLAFNRTDHLETTFFEEIDMLNHGHSALIHLHSGVSMTKSRWYDLRKELDKKQFIINNEKEFQDLLVDSVCLRLRSDVPVGVCLSGGLDSSAVVSIIAEKLHRKDIATFSSVFEKGQTGDESEFIDEYLDIVDNMYRITPDAGDLLNNLHRFVRLHAEPIPTTSPFAQFKVMELAGKHVTVTLDGQGADEILGGYHYFFGFYFKDLLRNFQLITFFSELVSYLRIHRSIFALKTLLFFLLPDSFKAKAQASRKGYFHKDFINRYAKTGKLSGGLYASKSLKESLINHFEYKLEHLLKWEDRNSMHFSIEARVPFLDHRLVEATINLDNRWKIRKGFTKFILRESMKNILPEKIRLRTDKIGFATPQDLWLRNPQLMDLMSELLTSEKFESRNIIDKNISRRIVEEHVVGKKNHAKEMWKWFQLELWFREFLD
jgi:asparagine synthase (glutamine-hydrolysing)